MTLGMIMASTVFDAPPQAGAFVGGLLAMSSTSIVVKCLEGLRYVRHRFRAGLEVCVLQSCLDSQQ